MKRTNLVYFLELIFPHFSSLFPYFLINFFMFFFQDLSKHNCFPFFPLVSGSGERANRISFNIVPFRLVSSSLSFSRFPAFLEWKNVVRVCFEQFFYLLFYGGNIRACCSIDLTVSFGSKIRKFSSVFFRFSKWIELGVRRNLVGKKIFKFSSNEPEIFKFNCNLREKVLRTFNKLKLKIKARN